MRSKFSMKSKNRNTILNEGIIYILLSGAKSVACSVSWGFPRSSEVCVNVCVCASLPRWHLQSWMVLVIPARHGGGDKKDGARQHSWLTPTYLLSGNLEHTDMSDDIGVGSPVGRTHVHRLPFKCLNGALNTPKTILISFNKTSTAY